MLVQEVFESIQGEGIHAGIPMSFLRLNGCNLRCNYCDTKETWKESPLPPVLISSLGQELTKRQGRQGRRWICVTGGEPLLQAEELGSLVGLLSYNAQVEVETNGTLPPPTWFHFVDTWVVDIKCPSSGVVGFTTPAWLEPCLRPSDCLKFVVSNLEDLCFVESVLTKHKNLLKGPHILISPRFPIDISFQKEIYDFVVANNFRYSVQLHKFVGFK